MKPVTFRVIRIGEVWTVRCSHETGESSSHVDQLQALRAAEAAALRLWKEQQVACRVMLDDDEGRWLTVADFGQLFG